ncbi:6-phosphogluconolactonase [Tranquillimonas alkanivorans]|uniref:6-phosphogluconolactonase n=1 Tax=Tranquillimonas alkanivorans TaxID=441119 RepID=A0A1I5NZH0_9RHOB|nr:6-phosphogluconolactonase [Tranquillimonas alkanivorans]SFP27179.1 6-phosphogluconolactonase [Tranquillimonas alkanivorans]
MELIEYPDRELMMIDLADKLAAELNGYLMNHEWATFAVPGGTTPGPIFDTLSGIKLDWSRVHVMLTDERWVPEDHPRSNTRLLRKHLLRDKAEAAKYIPLHADAMAPEDRIDELSGNVAAELPISVLLLGMGGDMHTASLFPGADRLQEALQDDAPPLMAMRGGGANEPRITLTAPVLKGAMSTHVVITGPEKRAALEKAQKMKPLDAPIALVLREAKVHWAE